MSAPSSPPPVLSRPLLSGIDKDTVIAGLTVVAFVGLCKLYNIFLSHPKEYFSDLAISKLAILGILACVVTRACVTALFEQSLDVSSVISGPLGFLSKQDPPSQPLAAEGIPRLTRVMRQ
jgi:hypothetical protein